VPQGEKKRKNIGAKGTPKAHKVLFLRISKNPLQLAMVL
jgi:hypothetical protein